MNDSKAISAPVGAEKNKIEKKYQKEHNSTMLQGFDWYLWSEGTHWDRLRKEAEMYKKIGIDMIWMPPAYKGASGKYSVGYDVYDRYDLGEFDQKGTIPTKYGTKKQYERCIKAYHREKIKVLADIVMNQMLGADETESVMASVYDWNDRTKQVEGEREILAYTRFNFPGRNQYDTLPWTAENFNSVDWDDLRKEKKIFRFSGKQWNGEVDWEKGNYDYLMGANVDLDNPSTIERLTDWGKWYLDETKIDGMRIDAVKHMSHDFVPNWIWEMRNYVGEEFFAVAEYWSPEYHHLLNYLDEIDHIYSLFDVQLHYKLQSASNSNGTFNLKELLEETILRDRPDQAVTFVDNHDTEPGQPLVSNVLEWFKPQAYSFILFQKEGIPCIFYGDLYGMDFDYEEEENGVKVKKHFHQDPVRGLAKMCCVRARCAHGLQTNYIVDEHMIGYTRNGAEGYKYSGMAVLISNQGNDELQYKNMYVNVRYAKEWFVNMLNPADPWVQLDEHGVGNFYCKRSKAAVWIRASAFEYLKTLKGYQWMD